jgi:MFS family permease
MKYLTRTVWILSLVSLFMDTASEMLYPVMPVFLKSIGFSVVLIGILEGLAEATAGFSKGYFGKRSDNSGKRVPFVQIGYAISAISKSMPAVFIYPLWIFTSRTLDRLGKGIRTGARDALLSDEATAETKGRIFGFHRSMDTFGAVLGPLFALIYLYHNPNDYQSLFIIALLPGMLSIFSSLLLKEKNNGHKPDTKKTSFFSFVKYWKVSPAEYKKVVAGLLVFTLFNSSDVFLLLKAKQAGLTDTEVIGVYIFFNLVFALFAFPVGILADKIGFKKTLVLGLLVFASVYFGMSLSTDKFVIAGLFFLYGLYYAATDGISKAWITNISDKKDTATAVGTFTAFQSLSYMAASSAAGITWYYLGADTTFLITGVAACIVILYFITIVKIPVKTQTDVT